MKILHIRFKNLNSLAGEWSIDLTHPAFANDGIFAITGPTGSGKSTLLDAMCLALYGRTPRLNRVSKSENDIMSRQTGECFAEVTFETLAGRFRCHWSQHRAGKKPEGALQAPKQELSNPDTGEILESRITDVAARIEAVTGMDFTRFTRSMLLAQGGFAAFLQAAPGDRAEILERITGTEIYSRISIQVHERLRAEQDALRALQAGLSGITLLDQDQETAMLCELEAQHTEESARAAGLAETAALVAWQQGVCALEKELAALDQESEALNKERAAFAPQRSALALAQEAALLDGAYSTLAALRKQLDHDRQALLKGRQELPALQAASQAHALAQAQAEAKEQEAAKALKQAVPLLHTVRALDQRLADQRKLLEQNRVDIANDTATLQADAQRCHAARRMQAEARQALKNLDAYLDEHASDAWLVGGLAGIEEQAASLHQRHAGLAAKKTEQSQAHAALDAASQALILAKKASARQQKILTQADKDIRQSQEALDQLLNGRLLREYRADKEALLRELALRQEIARLKDYRARLTDGQPCPLCGASEHPFAAGNVPAPDESEQKIEALAVIINQAEAQEKRIRQHEQDGLAARAAFLESEKQEAAAALDMAAAEKGLALLQGEIARLQQECAGQQNALVARLLPLGIDHIGDNALPALLDSLRERLAAWQDRVRQKADCERRIAELDADIARLDAVHEARRLALEEKTARLDAAEQAYAASQDERQRLFGAANPEAEERQLNAALAAASAALKQATTLARQAHQNLDAASAEDASLQKRIKRQEPELAAQERDFSLALAASGFSSELFFLEARLDAGLRKDLAAKARLLDDKFTDITARHSDRTSRLALERARMHTDKSLEALQAEIRTQEEALRNVQEAVAALRHALKENTLARERVQAGQKAIEAQQSECRRWAALHELIGSADGKKYRNFAQGLTFEMMIAHANLQLRNMTDRYLLLRDTAQPLELNVMDNYQAGEVRTTKNLSGGESFIVSLALALGLSRMSGRNVRVDSLFLDEGFGTLDEESLDTALETLAALRREGKLIGVISHVAAIRERIGAQITVWPGHGGCSRLEGPGCSAGIPPPNAHPPASPFI